VGRTCYMRKTWAAVLCRMLKPRGNWSPLCAARRQSCGGCGNDENADRGTNYYDSLKACIWR